MTRYRLRFQLVVFDLGLGDYVIGRSDACDITIEDSKISRRHARIHITEDSAYITDLGSSNGTAINDNEIERETVLRDQDSIRVGNHNLAFMAYSPYSTQEPRNPNIQKRCPNCGAANVRDGAKCLACGASKISESARTVTRSDSEKDWKSAFFQDMIDRSLESGKVAEATRLFKRGVDEVERRLSNGSRPPAGFTSTVCTHALRIAEAAEDPTWLTWSLQLHRQLRTIPGREFIDQLQTLAWITEPAVQKEMREFVYWYRALLLETSEDGQQRLSSIADLCQPTRAPQVGKASGDDR